MSRHLADWLTLLPQHELCEVRAGTKANTVTSMFRSVAVSLYCLQLRTILNYSFLWVHSHGAREIAN